MDGWKVFVGVVLMIVGLFVIFVYSWILGLFLILIGILIVLNKENKIEEIKKVKGKHLPVSPQRTEKGGKNKK